MATQAGLATRFVYIEDIGWADEGRAFVDDEGTIIDVLCKLYPWEWLMRDEFGPHLLEARLKLIEPPWKILLSTKGLLPILWELNPNHPNLLPAAFERFRISGDYVQKPLYSREGANVTVYRGAVVLARATPGDDGFIYQASRRCRVSGHRPVIGPWIATTRRRRSAFART